jgi:putative membrane protein
MSTADLPALNAVLNASAAVLLVSALVQIKRGNRELHEKLMLSALVVSALFLASYLLYHALHGSKRFTGPEPIRTVYLAILLSHTVLAVVNLPLVIVTLRRALLGRFADHRKIAKWTWAVWAYVSVTGVVIYLMLYVAQPAV